MGKEIIINFEAKQIQSIVVHNDDTFSPGSWVYIELITGDAYSYVTKKETNELKEWISRNLPECLDKLEKSLGAKPFEDFLFAVIYEYNSSPLL